MAAKETVLDEGASIYQKREEKTEKQKWAEMDKRERREYFNEYYRNKLIALILGVIAGGYLLYSIFGPKVERILYVAVINDYWNDEAVEMLESNLETYLEADEEWEEVVFEDSFYFKDDSSSDAYSYVQKLAAYVAAGEVDMMVSDEEQFAVYARDDYFMDLEEVLPVDVYELVKDYLVSFTSIDTGESHVVGLKLGESPVYQAMKGYQGDALMGIVANTEHLDHTIAAIRYLFTEQQ